MDHAADRFSGRVRPIEPGKRANSDVRAERARFLLLADRAPEAIAALDAEPERDRDHWWHIWRGVARLRTGDAASASADFEQARCLAEGSDSWPTNLGLSYLLTGDAAGAEREFRQMLASKRGAGAAVVAAVEIGHIRRLVPDLPHADETLALLREHVDPLRSAS